MRNNLFNAIRLYTEQKGLNNELKSMQSKATELNKRANINPIGQIQMPLSELRSVKMGERKRTNPRLYKRNIKPTPFI